MKRIIKTIVLILWLLLIYSLSNQTGSVSSGLTTKLLTIVGNLINNVITIDVNNFVLRFGFIVRKLAHFTEYFILFILTYECLKEYKLNKKALISFIFCVIYAAFDEFHQLFIDGRSGQILDVLIDSLGSTASYFFWHRLIKK